MKAADPPAPTVDPGFAAEQATANQDNLNQLQIQSQQDTAAIMARYGTRLAMAHVNGSYNPGLATGPATYSAPPLSASPPGSQYQSQLPGVAGAALPTH